MSQPVTYKRIMRGGLCLSAVLLVFFAVQTVHPLVNTQAASSESEHGWIGAIPAMAAPPDGAKVYATRCGSCHQMNGAGVTGVFPPLAGSDHVTGDPGTLVRIIMNGMSGPVEVKGYTYNGVMPPWGAALKDDEIAALATYIRSSWGNQASAISAEDVAKVRAATKDRKQPWTAEELKKDENKGIPSAD